VDEFLPVNEPLLDGNEEKYLRECIKSGWISAEGPFVQELEKRFAKVVGRKHGIAVCNGTAAIDAAVEALEIGHGDEVILPTFTIISCINQIVRSGAMPILVDSDPVTWNLNADQIEEKITERTKAILVPHIYGLPADMQKILELARHHKLEVIEDAAEVLGQTYLGKPCGSFGTLSTFSFYSNKHLTTGEGGMIVTDDDVLADKLRGIRNLCFQPGKRFVHERLGWNLRMTNLQAALGLAQLERLDEFVQKKRAMGEQYQRLLSGVNALQLPLKSNNHADNIYWVFGVVLQPESGLSAVRITTELINRGIGTRPFFWPMHEQPVLQKMGLFRGEFYPVAEKLARSGFYLPSGLKLSTQNIERAASTLKHIIQTLG